MKIDHLRAVAIALLLPIAGCGSGDAGAGAGGLTAGEAEQLEQAAERLDARAAPPAADRAEAFEAEVRARLAEERTDAERR